MANPSHDVVLGLDVGATSSRALAVSVHGERLGEGRAGGGNPVSVGMETAEANIGAAVAEALQGVDPGRVRAAVAGQAGVRGSQRGFRDVYRKVWAAAGIPAAPRLVWDGAVGFAAGTAAPAGTMLIAGTGAAAGAIENHEAVRFADGFGWLIGDLGSGVWIGREAVRLALTALSAQAVPAGLTRAVLKAYGLRAADPDVAWRDLVRAVYQDAPVSLSRLTPMVFQNYEAGDDAARDIVARAAAHLTETAGLVYRGGPIVLGGGILASPTPVAQAVRRTLPATDVGIARDGAAGAAWLAALDVPEEERGDPRELRARLLPS